MPNKCVIEETRNRTRKNVQWYFRRLRLISKFLLRIDYDALFSVAKLNDDLLDHAANAVTATWLADDVGRDIDVSSDI